MRRITVVSRDRPGLIADVSELLSRSGLNIATLDALTVGEDAVLRLGVEDEDRVLSALTQGGYQAMTEDVLTVQVTDEPGALARVARRLTDARLDIRGVSMLSRGGGLCIIALDTSDNVRAQQLLSDLAL